MLSIISAMVVAAVTTCRLPFMPRPLLVWLAPQGVIVESSHGTATVPSPGGYDAYRGLMILSEDGKRLALPVEDAQGVRSLDVIDLPTGRALSLGTVGDAVSPRLSPDGRYLAVEMDDGFAVYDLQTKRRQPLGKEVESLTWSLHKDVLFYTVPQGGVSVYDPSKSEIGIASSWYVDDLVGQAYRNSTLIKQRLPTTEVSPSGKWAFVGPLEGGIEPIEINGRTSPDIGPETPYIYAFIDKNWRLSTFSAPKPYENEELNPAGWTASENLVLTDLNLRDRVIIVDPLTGKTRIRMLRQPVKGAVLVAVKDWPFY